MSFVFSFPNQHYSTRFYPLSLHSPSNIELHTVSSLIAYPEKIKSDDSILRSWTWHLTFPISIFDKFTVLHKMHRCILYTEQALRDSHKRNNNIIIKWHASKCTSSPQYFLKIIVCTENVPQVSCERTNYKVA